ncbi:hypothetical protein DPMN_111912 [Dreissena polymorpha]|uniref:Uncharacterized protein n=1 Tax=Dreissena polymorpha TaxID=45954 RepID=A0A9D4QQ71_DREPO|nr:hypothetical protein DPMN_111912 [Dreissena polymorpha]
MISGKAVSRAIRGHLLASNALNVLLMRKFFRTFYDEVEPTAYTDNQQDELTIYVDTGNYHGALNELTHASKLQHSDLSVTIQDDTEGQHDTDVDRDVEQVLNVSAVDRDVEQGDMEVHGDDVSDGVDIDIKHGDMEVQGDDVIACVDIHVELGDMEVQGDDFSTDVDREVQRDDMVAHKDAGIEHRDTKLKFNMSDLVQY